MNIHAVAMLRNESDIIGAFLAQCAELFDKIHIADIQSTDGTDALVRGFQAPGLETAVYPVNRQEKYQGALMNRLSRQAFAEGADWVFFIDADEFIDIENRAALEAYLRGCNSEVLHLPWANLVPANYGDYTRFDPTQEFRWSGRVSRYNKIALASAFAANHPNYNVAEGNHSVAVAPQEQEVPVRLGMPMLHVPIRSMARLKYKIGTAHRLTLAKHNRQPGEGTHVVELDRLLSTGDVELAELNFMAGNYGEKITGRPTLDPVELGWPVKRLPGFVAAASQLGSIGLSETLLADAATQWDGAEFVKGSPVGAVLEGGQLRIVPQPLSGSGLYGPTQFPPLGEATPDQRTTQDLMTDAIGISTMRVQAFAFSAWSQLIPTLFALFSVMRPRRYAELGVHNGMSFFAACQASEYLGLNTQCVAVDSWIGDPHAGIHTDAVFTGFRKYLGKTYPNQHYIQSFFAAAEPCFADGSIDLLHIDGLHTYEAVKSDFEGYLPKMSDVGVIMFHDTNVYDRGFGVWRLWEELKLRYPAFDFGHQYGLGIIYVGSKPSPVADMLRRMTEDKSFGVSVQSYFLAMGTLLIEHRAFVESAKEGAVPPSSVGQDPPGTYQRLGRGVLSRVAGPLRRVVHRFPLLAGVARPCARLARRMLGHNR